MTWSTLRGAPRRIPIDTTPLDTHRVDATKRTAWLLRINRWASDYGDCSGAQWAQLLAIPGEKMDDTKVSRIELGNEVASTAVLTRYEALLQLPPGSLRACCDGMARSQNPAELPQRSPRDGATMLDSIDDRIEQGAARGADWLELADLLKDRRAEWIPRRVVDKWFQQLTRELPNSRVFEYAARMEAMSLLIATPRYSDVMESVIREVAAEPDTEQANLLLDVLGDSTRTGMIDSLLIDLEQMDGSRQFGAALAMTSQVAHGLASHEHLARLNAFAMSQLATDPTNPSGQQARNLVALYTPRTTPLLRPATVADVLRNAPGLSTYVASARAESGFADPMLERLLMEALTNVFIDRRHHSGMLIRASPYRPVLLRAANALTNSPDWAIREAAVRFEARMQPQPT
ncbi:hypothetical protein [Rudaeicoccus suwonensis]|uniref:Uncharacterized protein n=1 Tax=Rudaeicoccus suwonensis TaxID=657409 RepID=A0A561E6Q1_9MICO|nr:hypothetical protein [Rudaeicoccus suwonensis]TWE11272.1 hypothetical protein BKA23_0034 [Rudaeicoccus suwonensis]